MANCKEDEDTDAEKAATDESRLGRDISYGIQQTLACWATDFIDPPVSRYLQNKFGNPEHEVTHKHVWWGEILGDTSALFSFLILKHVLRKPIDGLIDKTESNFDAYLDRTGKKAIKAWASDHHVTEADDRYQAKLKEYKHYQAENIVDSGIIASTATINNVLLQRYALGNRQSLPVILGSKLVGAAATLTLMLGMRTALPNATKELDEELSGRYFSRVATALKRTVGIKVKPGGNSLASPVEARPGISLTEAPLIENPLSEDKQSSFLNYLQKAFKGDINNEADIEAFGKQEKEVCRAFIMALYPDGSFARHLAEEHYYAMKRLMTFHAQELMPDAVLRQSATLSIQSIVINRRDDMHARLRLLDDPKFMEQAVERIKHPVEVKPMMALNAKKQDQLVESLVQTKGPLGREPAVHIYANAIGQVMEHQALAECFNPKGSSTRVLAAELVKYVKADTTAIAEEYTGDRKRAADLVVEALALDGAIVNEAIRRSESVRQKNEKYLPEKVVPAAEKATLKTAKSSWADNIGHADLRNGNLALSA